MGHVDTMDLLLQHAADINATDRNQYTPLHVAAASGTFQSVKVLTVSILSANFRNGECLPPFA